MGKIDELIQQYCPDGVEFHKIKDVYKRIKGTPITATKMKEIANPAGSVRIFAGGKTVIDANEEDIPNANITRVPAVLVQSRGVIDVVYYEQPFTFKNEMWAYTTENKTSVKYLYYVMKSNVQTFRDAASGMGALPQISLGTTEDFEIPLPPLPVQKEIVRILDNFTNLAAELQAELQARQQQYQYYRDTLLSFDGRDDVQWNKLGEVADLGTGSHNTQDGLVEGKYPFYTRGSEILYLNDYDYDETAIITAGDGAGVGKVFHFVQGKYALHQRAYRIVPNEKIVLARFVYYYIGATFYNYIMKSSVSSSVVSIRKPMMVDYPIPVPSIEEQERVISILDNFYSLTNDLTQGLPAEIEARQQQYEYYRDQLLTFKRKEA